MKPAPVTPLVAIACGGTGGHLFPGVAVAESLSEAGVRSLLLVSEKEIDRFACQAAPHLEAIPLSGVAWVNGRGFGALAGVWKGFREARQLLKRREVQAVLAMGGFTSVGPVLAARSSGIPVVLHEANAVPGRAARWLTPFARTVLTGFEEAIPRFSHADVRQTGMPVRKSLSRLDRAEACKSLGLNPNHPVLLVMGGSQEARAVNDLFAAALPILAKAWPELQWIHLTGPADFERMKPMLAAASARGISLPFATEMDRVLAATTLAVSRSGASSLAEFAACRIPCILIPYPLAVDNHQLRNAEALVRSNAASLLPQSEANPGRLVDQILAHREGGLFASRQAGLAEWSGADAAASVARVVLEAISVHQAASAQLKAMPLEARVKFEGGKAT